MKTIVEATPKKSHLTRSHVSLSDVLSFLSSDAQSPSTFGGDLERARDGIVGIQDYVRQQAKAEEQILSRAAVIRCVDALIANSNLSDIGAPCGDIRRFASKCKIRDGAAVVAVLRRYQPWATSWPESGLVAVYEWMRSQSKQLPPVDLSGESTAAQAFRVGKANRARSASAKLVADAITAISLWVERWNKKPR